MSSPTSALEAALSTLVTYAAIVLSNVLVAVRYFYINYPDAARILAMLVAGYVLFKSFMRIVRFWWGMVKLAVKATLLFVVVAVAVASYYRGPHLFFTRDIPLVYRFCQSVSQRHQEASENPLSYADILGKTGLDAAAIKKSAAGWMVENAEHIDTLKNSAQHLASENRDHIENFVRSNNLQNLFNLGFGNNRGL